MKKKRMKPAMKSLTTRLENYYRLHSRIYDGTRWSFLFGRSQLLDQLPELPNQARILEVGCGTGFNLLELNRRFPESAIYGVDLSPEMLKKARLKIGNRDEINLIHGVYGADRFGFEPFNLILLSYTLTMLGKKQEPVVRRVFDDLVPGGYVAVVDFHETPLGWFQRWMNHNHVDINGDLLPLLGRFFRTCLNRKQDAYFGLWRYMQYIGQKPA